MNDIVEGGLLWCGVLVGVVVVVMDGGSLDDDGIDDAEWLCCAGLVSCIVGCADLLLGSAGLSTVGVAAC